MAYSANGNLYTSKSLTRVKYNLEYDAVNGHRMPKAPELIKACHSAAPDVFFDSSSDYDPIWVDVGALNQNYGDQVFIDVPNARNLVVLSEAVTGDCLNTMNDWIKLWILHDGTWNDDGEWNDNAEWKTT